MKNKIIIVLVLIIGIIAFLSCEREANQHPIDNPNITQKSTASSESLNYFEDEIAGINNNLISFSKDVDLMKMKWEDAINNNSNLNINLDEIKIFEDEGYYFLRGKDAKSRSSSTIQLVRIGDKLYESREAGGGFTVTCSGCTSTGPEHSGECEPEINPHNGYYCTTCSQGTCTKTTTNVSGGIL